MLNKELDFNVMSNKEFSLKLFFLEEKNRSLVVGWERIFQDEVVTFTEKVGTLVEKGLSSVPFSPQTVCAGTKGSISPGSCCRVRLAPRPGS
jgi:hypothetical protein